jgi:hypothetical protein
MKRIFSILSTLVIFSSIAAFADEPRPFAQPDRIHYDRDCITIDGKDMFIYSGAFHYFRCPKELWADRFKQIKDAGFNCVETYAAWNWAEREAPASTNDFSKVNVSDLDEWLTMAEQFGLYTVVRPGPYICAEWDGGGYPQWLVALKKPATPLREGEWLRTDDPVYLAWCKHWYDAVCPVIAKHQVTRKQPGEPGVILVQIENEYNYVKDQPDEAKINQLTALANDAKADGIDVPLITCVTKQIRGIKSGLLHGVFDCSNFYPRWSVESRMRGEASGLRASQPDAPMMITELQGGWFSKVGGKLSDQQDGLTAEQIQNVTLYAIQSGYTLMNYYMLYGGANYDDWAARDLTTTYDYNAPIRESGGVGDRYQRVWAIGHMLQEHGTRLARAEAVALETQTNSAGVQFAERRAQDGSRYIFVRTEKRGAPIEGTAHLTEKGGTAPELVFEYQLESFGSKILYLPPGVNDAKAGQWLPKPAPEIQRPTTGLPSPVSITGAQRGSDVLPSKWTTLKPGQKIEEFGVFDRHFIYYRVAAKPGESFTATSERGDSVIAFAKSSLLSGQAGKYTLPDDANEAFLLCENPGQGNGGGGMEKLNGIGAVKIGETNVALEFATGERERGIQFSSADVSPKTGEWKDVAIAKDAAPAPASLLTWYRMTFALPEKNPAVWVPWQAHLEGTGNGFIYLNGHCLGRYWQTGPQHDYYLPECWLNFGPGQKNVIALDLRPAGKGVMLQAAVVEPLSGFAENR